MHIQNRISIEQYAFLQCFSFLFFAFFFIQILKSEQTYCLGELKGGFSKGKQEGKWWNIDHWVRTRRWRAGYELSTLTENFHLPLFPLFKKPSSKNIEGLKEGGFNGQARE